MVNNRRSSLNEGTVGATCIAPMAGEQYHVCRAAGPALLLDDKATDPDRVLMYSAYNGRAAHSLFYTVRSKILT